MYKQFAHGRKEVIFVDEQQPGGVWERAEERYQVGQAVRGVVTRIAQFGVFVQLEPGLEGIVYTFELGNTPAALAGYAPGQEMQLFVKSVESSRKRLELSPANQTLPLPLNERVLPPEVRHSAPGDAALSAVLARQEMDASAAAAPVCPTCQRQVYHTWKWCVYCGGSLRRRCPVCGATQPDLPDARFCCECGVPIQVTPATSVRQ